MPTSYPLVNGFRQSWAGIKIKQGADDVFGFRKISYGQKRERSMVYGHGVQALGRTRGKHSCEGSMTMLLAEWQTMKAALGDGFMDQVIPSFTVLREEIGNDEIFTTELIGITLDEVKNDDSEGNEASQVELTFGILRIVDNGVNAIAGELE